MRWLTMLLFLGVASSVGGPVAIAQDADALIRQGVQLRTDGRDEEALEHFRRAHALTPTPRSLAQIGFAEQALGEWVAAMTHLTEAAEADDPWIARNRAALDQALEVIRQRVGRLEVRGGVPGALVFVDGVEMGRLPQPHPVFVAAGTVELRVEAEGYAPVSRSIEVTAGSLARETVRLVGEPSGAGGGGGSDPIVEPDTPEEGGTPILAWVALGGAAVGLAGGGIALAIREGHAADWNDDAVCLAGGLSREQNCADSRKSAESAETWAIVGFAAAGVFAAASAVLFLMGSGGDEEAASARLSCGAGPGEVGGACAVSF